MCPRERAEKVWSIRNCPLTSKADRLTLQNEPLQAVGMTPNPSSYYVTSKEEREIPAADPGIVHIRVSVSTEYTAGYLPRSHVLQLQRLNTRMETDLTCLRRSVSDRAAPSVPCLPARMMLRFSDQARAATNHLVYWRQTRSSHISVGCPPNRANKTKQEKEEEVERNS